MSASLTASLPTPRDMSADVMCLFPYRRLRADVVVQAGAIDGASFDFGMRLAAAARRGRAGGDISYTSPDGHSTARVTGTGSVVVSGMGDAAIRILLPA